MVGEGGTQKSQQTASTGEAVCGSGEYRGRDRRLRISNTFKNLVEGIRLLRSHRKKSLEQLHFNFFLKNDSRRTVELDSQFV